MSPEDAPPNSNTSRDGTARGQTYLIVVDTHIGHGLPNKQDSNASLGEPLGAEEVLPPRAEPRTAKRRPYLARRPSGPAGACRSRKAPSMPSVPRSARCSPRRASACSARARTSQPAWRRISRALPWIGPPCVGASAHDFGAPSTQPVMQTERTRCTPSLKRGRLPGQDDAAGHVGGGVLQAWKEGASGAAHPGFRDLAIAIVQRDRIDFDENLAGAGSRSRNGWERQV